jgi:hypothetical protein
MARSEFRRIPGFLALAFFAILAAGCSGSLDPLSPFAILKKIASEELSSTESDPLEPQVAVNPLTGEVFVCWTRDSGDTRELAWRHGNISTFSSEEFITDLDGRRSWNPSICAGPDGRIHLAHMDQKIGGRQKEIYAKAWIDGVWGPDDLLSLADGWTGWDPCVTTYPDGRPAVCWFDHRFKVQHEIMLSVGDGKGGWRPDVRLTNDLFWQYSPVIAVDSANILHLVYVDARTQAALEDTDHFAEGRNLEIYYRTWDGRTLGPELQITNSSLRSIEPDIAVDNTGRAHLVWLDETASGYYQAYYTTVDNGQPSQTITISTPDRRADSPSIACLGSRVFAVVPEYYDPGGPDWGRSDLFIREILPDGQVGPALKLTDRLANLAPRMVPDKTRGALWIAWMEYDDSGLQVETSVNLCAVKAGTSDPDG